MQSTQRLWWRHSPLLVVLLLAGTLASLAPPPATADSGTGNFFVLNTVGGKTYYVMRLHLLVQCPSELTRRIREVQWLDGAEEVRAPWSRLPSFEITRHPRGYQVLSAEETDEDGKPKVVAFVDLKGELFDPNCSHYIRAEGIGFDQRFDIRRIRWPLQIWDRRPGAAQPTE